MKTTIEGVDALDMRVVSLRDIVGEFVERRQDRPLSEVYGECTATQHIGNISRSYHASTPLTYSQGITENSHFIHEDVIVVREDVGVVHSGVQAVC